MSAIMKNIIFGWKRTELLKTVPSTVTIVCAAAATNEIDQVKARTHERDGIIMSRALLLKAVEEADNRLWFDDPVDEIKNQPA